MVLWRSRVIIWKLQISLVSVIEVQDMNDLRTPVDGIVQGLEKIGTFIVKDSSGWYRSRIGENWDIYSEGLSGWHRSRIGENWDIYSEGLQWMASFKDWRELGHL
ncbi:hypothetical protein TNCV_2121161 [Trichonephila clavipes]|nr:hypothetical protein TNCV_2121161 [Trichonephila clavipes]